MTQNQEPVPAAEDCVFLRLPAMVRAVQWTGRNLDAMQALLGAAFDYNPADIGGFDVSVHTSRHSCWEDLRPDDWAVAEGDFISVVEADEFAEQYAPGRPDTEYRVEFDYASPEPQFMPCEDVCPTDRPGVWLHTYPGLDGDDVAKIRQLAVQAGGTDIRVHSRSVATVHGPWT